MSEDKDVSPDLGVSELKAQRREKLIINEPEYPILKIDELPLGKQSPDLREKLGQREKYLEPWEKVVHIREHKAVWPERHVTAIEVCMKATKARHALEMGLYGPASASVTVDEQSADRDRYPDIHGRDSIDIAEDLIESNPQVARATAFYLATKQGVEDIPYIPGRPYKQEKPGSIILRSSNPNSAMAQKFANKLSWDPLYFGSVDAPSKYVNLLALIRNADRSFLVGNIYRSRDAGAPNLTMSVAFDRCLEWITDNADSHDGLAAYKNEVPGGGMRNQGWRDSDTAMINEKGELASDEYGIAPIEVQGFTFDAYRNSARILRELHRDTKRADEMEDRAWELQRLIINKGFVHTSEGGFFASGFDWDDKRQLRPLRVATSAMGRLLGSDILKSQNPDAQEI
jgi:glycogen debranching enzyme